jgi:hypothetical protein
MKNYHDKMCKKLCIEKFTSSSNLVKMVAFCETLLETNAFLIFKVINSSFIRNKIREGN